MVISFFVVRVRVMVLSIDLTFNDLPGEGRAKLKTRFSRITRERNEIARCFFFSWIRLVELYRLVISLFVARVGVMVFFDPPRVFNFAREQVHVFFMSKYLENEM